MAEPKSQWHREVLPPGWIDAARALRARRVLDGFYLAGGTGVALQRGHRLSVDLDLFSESNFASGTLRDQLRGLDGLRNLELAPGTLHLELRGVKVSFLHYPYPLLSALGFRRPGRRRSARPCVYEARCAREPRHASRLRRPASARTCLWFARSRTDRACTSHPRVRLTTKYTVRPTEATPTSPSGGATGARKLDACWDRPSSTPGSLRFSLGSAGSV
jgi:hypothetical protein